MHLVPTQKLRPPFVILRRQPHLAGGHVACYGEEPAAEGLSGGASSAISTFATARASDGPA